MTARRRPPPGCAVLAQVALIGLLGTGCGRGRPSPPPAEHTASGARETEPPTDPTTLILVHSWSGRTERLGRALGVMLGARVVVYHDPPMPEAPSEAPSLAQVLPTIALRGVRTIFLGFPVWGEAPSPPVQQLASTLRLDGVRVVPFYSFIHFLGPAALESLRGTLRARGAEVLPDLAFLIPLSASPDDLSARAQRALIARGDLWVDASEETPVPSCEARNGRDNAQLCRVPAGWTWLGDPATTRPGAPPVRRVRVAAFELGRAEVTVGQYARCVSAGACPAIDFTQSFCGQLLADRPDRDALPLPCATVTAASAYCEWAGLRVPTEAEWVRAGRGGGTRAYPWGDDFGGDTAALRGNFGEKPSSGFPSYSTVPEPRPWPADQFRGLAPPCSFPAGDSPFGVCDMSGNLAEWVRPRRDQNVAVGGSWLDGEPEALRLSARAMIPSLFSTQIGLYIAGIRCAR